MREEGPHCRFSKRTAAVFKQWSFEIAQLSLAGLCLVFLVHRKSLPFPFTSDWHRRHARSEFYSNSPMGTQAKHVPPRNLTKDSAWIDSCAPTPSTSFKAAPSLLPSRRIAFRNDGIAPKLPASVVGLRVLLSIHLLFPLLLFAPLARSTLSGLDILLHLLRQESVDLILQLCALRSECAQVCGLFCNVGRRG